MERLVIYDAGHLDCSELYQFGNKHFVVGERSEPLSARTADPTATMVAIFVSSRIDRAVLARMPKLRLIICLSTGTDHVDMPSCIAQGITVCNVPAYGEQTVAEYTMALMLALSRRLTEAAAQVQTGKLDHAQLVGRDLASQTLTIVGTGRIGRHVARLARAFGMTVLGVDPYPNEIAATEIGYEYVGLHDGLARGDIISLHAPGGRDNQHLINRQSLALLKPTALLINTARGDLIDTTALLHALHTRKLGGAALDVVEGEALLAGSVETEVLADGRVKQAILREIAEHDALLKLPNVIMTGHNAYNTVEAQGRIVAGGVENIKAFLAGQPLNTVR